MARVLITYAGSAPVVAAAHLVASALRDTGHRVTLADAAEAPDARHFDAVVVGSDLYGHHHWIRAAVDYLKAQAPDLAERPTFLYDCVSPCLKAVTPHNVQRLAYEIGTALPTSFETDQGTVGSRAAVEVWAHSIDAALLSPVEGLPTGYWVAADEYADAVAVP